MFVRMITRRSKWELSNGGEVSNLSADVITNCLKTTEDKLSLWQVDGAEQINDALIALASNRDRPARLDYILIDEDDIKEYNLSIKSEIGNSPHISFNNNHFDVISLDYKTLGTFAEMIKKVMGEGRHIKRVGEPEIKKILISALQSGKIKKEDVKDSLYTALY